MEKTKTYPRGFLPRRWHSLMGLWLVIYLFFHLLTNSRAALWFSEKGAGFIDEVNWIHRLPYLQVIEIAILALPFLVHGILGVRYIFTAKFNSGGRNLTQPVLSKYPANKAFTWQRMTAWVLAVGVILHVVQMRFLDYPIRVEQRVGESHFLVPLSFDPGLYSLSKSLGVQLYNEAQIGEEKEGLLQMATSYAFKVENQLSLGKPSTAPGYDPAVAKEAGILEQLEWRAALLQGLSSKKLKANQVMAVCPDFGTATLLNVRDTFKSPWMILLYTIFVLAAVYHGFRGLWSFAICWGITQSARTQALLSRLAITLMCLLGFLGLAAVWLTYWVTLRS